MELAVWNTIIAVSKECVKSVLSIHDMRNNNYQEMSQYFLRLLLKPLWDQIKKKDPKSPFLHSKEKEKNILLRYLNLDVI